MSSPTRNLILILGDQLNADASAWDGFDPKQDAVWMAEVAEESTHVPSSKQRTAVFLSAMRHFAAQLSARAIPLIYARLDAPDNCGTLAGELEKTILAKKPGQLIVTMPGDWRVLEALKATAKKCKLSLDVREDRHFLCTLSEFAKHAQSRKQLRLEFFYREMRQRTGILMNGKEPAGEQWNFDADNRGSFGKEGPGLVPPPLRFAPDAITQEVIGLVNARFKNHPGSLETFGWPVARDQALLVLADFIEHRLPSFGLYQDAMWEGEAWLYHSHISSSLNLKLLNPGEVITAAEKSYQEGLAPLAAVEGFIRQILGWREYVRGIYWHQMPEYLERNELDAQEPLPAFYWTGDTEMACLKDAITQTLKHGYAHHIQRLMVTGLYALLLGVKPKQVHEWYLSVYVDAVEWVELPNTLGMSQYADGGVMASKPYVASGKYIDRMSNYCKGCRFNPGKSVGEDACPFTTLYWNFLARHERLLAKNPRMTMQLKNLGRLDKREIAAIEAQAKRLTPSAKPLSRR